jgi:N-acetylglucosamine kinase-like BadF-type ATPase
VTGQVVGLDVGGSKTHAVLADGTDVLAETVVGSANIASVGLAEAARQLGDALNRLGGRDIRVVYAGAAGADSSPQRERLARLIDALVPGAEVSVVHDTQLLLAAAGVNSGIALIAGTGSVAWGVDADGRSARAGGWGYLLGDEGSGYAVARAAVQNALTLADRGLPPDALTSSLLSACRLTDRGELLEHFYGNPERRYWAGHAGVVFSLAAGGDPAARDIVGRAASHLSSLVRRVAETLDTTGPLVCAGGLLTHEPALFDRVRAEVRSLGIPDVRLLDRDPVHGAISFARRALDTKTSASYART